MTIQGVNFIRDNIIGLEYLPDNRRDKWIPGEYYIGLEKGRNTGFVLHRNRHRSSTLIIRVKPIIDLLGSGTWIYIGKFKTTIKAIKKRKKEILDRVNAEYHTNFVHVVINS